MNGYEKLNTYIIDNQINAEHLIFKSSTHSVEEAAKAASAKSEDIVKNICLISSEKKLIVAIVKGEDRVSTKRVAKVLQIDRPVTANPEFILEKTGYPIGGVPSFGYEAIFLVDDKVIEKNLIYTGGGTDHSLIKIDPKVLIRANKAKIARIRK